MVKEPIDGFAPSPSVYKTDVLLIELYWLIILVGTKFSTNQNIIHYFGAAGAAVAAAAAAAAHGQDGPHVQTGTLTARRLTVGTLTTL